MRFLVLLLLLLFFNFSFSQKIDQVEISGLGTYPNPFNRELFVQHVKEEDNSKIQKIEIYSESGNLVVSVNYSNLVETTRIPNGVYFLKIYYPKQIITRKVIKKQ